MAPPWESPLRTRPTGVVRIIFARTGKSNERGPRARRAGPAMEAANLTDISMMEASGARVDGSAMIDGLPGKFRRIEFFLILSSVICGCAPKTGGGFQSIFESAASRDVQCGQQCLARQDVDGAERRFEKAARYDATNAAAQAGLGQIAMQRGRLEDAASYFRSALKFAPDNGGYAVALGTCLRQLAATSLERPTLLESAVRAYRHALSLSPNDYATVIGLAQCYRLQGQFDLAIDALRHAQRIDSSNPQVPILLATVHEAMNRYDRALDDYRLALKLDPNDSSIHNGLARLHLTMARNGKQNGPLSRERALAHYRRSLQLDANQPDVRRALANLNASNDETLTAAKSQE